MSLEERILTTFALRDHLLFCARSKFQPGKMPKEKVKLDPEEVFVDVAPTPFELLIPFLSLPTIIGIIPFIAAAARQLWVRYKITSRRISVSSGFQVR